MTRHVILLLSIVAVESAMLAGRALYCRDPDTGKLHAVNSTWASTTFCGNYTCKLRVRNITETQYTPLRQLNITNIHNKTVEETSNITVTIDDRTEPLVEEVIHKEGKDLRTKDDEDKKIKNISSEFAIMSDKTQDKKDSNRYLTEKEIKSISDVLQTVKKSDLDAIVDIYNLAQDIYNEMDEATNKGIVDETINDIAIENFHKPPKKSYWYDALANKGKDMEYQGSHIVSTMQPKRDDPRYFNGALTTQDFGKLPYYYPMSSFQRASSYVHHPPTNIKVERPKPCPAKHEYKQKNKDMQTAQNEIKPSYLLPYPFTYIHPYNYSDYASNIYFNNPQAWNGYNNQRQYHPYYHAYMAQAPIPNAVLMNPQLQEDVANMDPVKEPVKEDLLGKVLSKTKEKIVPDWKTGQLSSQILDEVRAHIDTSNILKLFPFRNKIKLEKVGKLIKMDELTRSRRSVDTKLTSSKEEIVRDTTLKEKAEDEMKEVTEDPTTEEGTYETYLEKTTCLTRADPGYFRYGNLTRPYPECCPQLINKP